MKRFLPYLHYLRPLRGHLAAALVCLAIYSAASGFGLPYLLHRVFEPIFSGPRTMTTWEITRVAMLFPGIFLVRAVSGYISTYLFQIIGTRVLESLRRDYFSKLQFLPLSFLQSHPVGELSSRGLADAQQVQHTITVAVNDGIKHPLTLVAALSYVAYAALKAEGITLVLISLALIPLCVFPLRHFAKKILGRARQAQARLGDISAQFTENLSAAREVRAFGLEGRMNERFGATTRALITAQIKIAKYHKAIGPTIEVISGAGLAITLIYAYKADIKLELLMSVLLALYQCYEPIKRLGNLNAEFKRGQASLDRLEPILNEPVTITDPASPTPINRARGELRFEDVSFAYNTGAPVLSGVTTAIPAGTVCALVGPSGAGKSTFVNLVPRFYDVVSGQITLDGIDIRDLRLADLRGNIAIVSQEPVLFSDTILNNILLSRPGATRQDVEQAARNAFAHDFIASLPQGYDTMLGERGASLSGGQRQRLALARAFLRDAPVLILDEATSALDSDSEAAIQQALRKLIVGRTVLIIAHRFSTIRDASMILVFDRGRIVATGGHAELYSDNPLYRSLYDRQGGGTA